MATESRDRHGVPMTTELHQRFGYQQVVHPRLLDEHAPAVIAHMVEEVLRSAKPDWKTFTLTIEDSPWQDIPDLAIRIKTDGVKRDES